MLKGGRLDVGLFARARTTDLGRFSDLVRRASSHDIRLRSLAFYVCCGYTDSSGNSAVHYRRNIPQTSRAFSLYGLSEWPGVLQRFLPT